MGFRAGNKQMKKRLFLIFIFFSFIFIVQAQEKNEVAKKEATIVTIEKAEKTDYVKDADTGDESIIFTGNVIVSVTSGNEKTRVSASIVRFNRKKNLLYAEGAVVLEKSIGSEVNEQIDADSLLFNIDSLDGVFTDVRVAQEKLAALQLPAGSKLIVYADVLAKDKASTIAFDKGKLTFCADEEEPHWQLKASKIWLLPGNEFAFFNALLYVGNVPLFYFPFFYYPKDELIFNPVYGFTEREGYFLQTTTYLFGRKGLEAVKKDEQAEKTQSTETIEELFNFLKPTTLKEQERRGLFLHNLETDAKNLSSDYLKLMADYYSNLGAYLGVQGYFSPNTVVKKIDFGIGIGFSRTFFPLSPVPIINPQTGESEWDSGYLLGQELPFRFYEDFSLSLSKNNFSLSVSLPFYSDPYFNSDFHNRSENMDWINYFLNNALMNVKNSQTNQVVLSGFNWNLNASYTPKIDFLKPYINTLSFSNIASSVSFITKQNSDKAGVSFIYDVNRQFYIPTHIKPFDATIKISGTLFSYPFIANAKKTSSKNDEVYVFTPSEADFQKQAEERAVIFEDSVDEKEMRDTAVEETVALDADIESAQEVTIDLIQSALSISAPQKASFSLFSYALNYDISTSFSSLVQLNNTNILVPEDLGTSFSNFQSTYFQIKSPLAVTSSAKFFNSIILLNNRFVFSPQMQQHPYISDEYYTTKEEKDRILLNDFAENKFDINSSNSLSINPFVSHSLLKNTALSWNINLKLVKTEFSGTVDEPDWTYVYPEWDKESISLHNIAFLLSLDEGLFSQKLSLSLALPPTTEVYGTKLSLVFPYVTTSFETALKKKDKAEPFRFDPFFQTAQVKLLNNAFVFDQNFKYDIEEKRANSFYLGASFAHFSIRYSMLYTSVYELQNMGWQLTQEKDFIPFDLRFSYSKTNLSWSLWKNRININPGIATSLIMDLVRPTNSSFRFTPSLSFSIYNFLKITFSSETTNNLIFRYFQDFYDYDFKVPGEKNIFVDLLKSFDFWNEQNRLDSAFKLQKLSLKIEHDLHDWQLRSEFSFSPRLISKSIPYYYDFSPYFSLSVVWNPLKSLKTEIVDEYGTFQLNP